MVKDGMCPRGCGSFSCGLSSGKEIALSPRTASSSLLSFQNHPRAVAVDRWRGPRCRGFADSGVPPGGLTWRRREPQAAQQRGKCSRGEACPLGLLEIGGGGCQAGQVLSGLPGPPAQAHLRDTEGLLPDHHRKASIAMEQVRLFF